MSGIIPLYNIPTNNNNFKNSDSNSLQFPGSHLTLPLTDWQFINIYILLTISMQSVLFCCENIGTDRTLQVIKH